VQQKVALKATNSMNVFNMLQDLRHLILLDFRSEEEFAKSHIRKAIRVTLENYKAIIASLIVSLTHKK
jgi:rhodanese-related sulfurtransferase|tara:strand:+ start:201 stop:404 length:204 start_codon:yes stop_codon:yes gene_type:complete